MKLQQYKYVTSHIYLPTTPWQHHSLQSGHRALNWIARYVEHARERLAIDPKQATLFLTIDGSPLNPDSLTEYGRRYIKAAGIDKPGACHIFRHTMATLMHDNGADIRTIGAILGHETLDTTQIYTRVGLKKLLDTHSQTHPAERADAEPHCSNRLSLSRLKRAAS